MISFDFNNQTVVITGGSGGIGSETARAFADCGARVVLIDLTPPQTELPGCRYLPADVRDFAAAGECVRDILAREGAIHCLINNAGISRDAAIWRMTGEQWDQVIEVNLKGAFNFIHHTAPHFRQEKRGKIVNVSSINGLRGKFGLANYAASKAGLIGLTKTVAKELGRSQVNVNAVAPGYILTPLTERLPDKVIAQAKAETVFGRLGAAGDVAHTILFLCSQLSAHITGEVIKVDGGQYI